jgi:hypothetical protein
MNVRSICTLVALLPLAALAEPKGLEVWQKNHPEASRELGDWVKAHPEAAQLFFEWDGHHHERAKEFVEWAINHPGDSIDVFVLSHKGWPYFDKIMEQHRPAAEAFLGWARKHHEAAKGLMNHPQGLEWAGHHLFADAWHMEHPKR